MRGGRGTRAVGIDWRRRRRCHKPEWTDGGRNGDVTGCGLGVAPSRLLCGLAVGRGGGLGASREGRLAHPSSERCCAVNDRPATAHAALFQRQITAERRERRG